jgi:hypothetical protein
LANPPNGGMFVNTCVSCGNSPVKIDEREGQQSESDTK